MQRSTGMGWAGWFDEEGGSPAGVLVDQRISRSPPATDDAERGRAVPDSGVLTVSLESRTESTFAIRPSDRLSFLLGRNEGLLEVLVESSVIFERLRDPEVRRTIGRLITVEQAARVAGLPLDVLRERLCSAAGITDGVWPDAVLNRY